MVRTTEISGVKDVDISLVNDFVLGIAKKAKPILDLVECFREEDEIGTIIGGGFDVHASKFDTFCIYELRFSSDVCDG